MSHPVTDPAAGSATDPETGSTPDPATGSATRTTATAPGLVEYLLGLADDALVLAQRLGAWVSRAPQLEEDVALANLALDQLGQARALLGYAGQREGAGRDEDALAYLRDERQFRNVQLVELPDADFAVAMARLLTFGTFQRLRYQTLSASTDPTLATIAARALKEATYHVDHARSWVVRLGDGTADSHRRMACGLAAVWPYVEELFTPAAVDGPLVAAGIAADVGTLRAAWDAELDAALAEATLTRPATASAATTGRTAWGGRQGLHTEHLGPLLAVLQHLHRSHPGASW